LVARTGEIFKTNDPMDQELIDTHTHVYLSQFDHDRPEVVDRAAQAGVGRMLMPNIDSHTAGDLLKVARRFPGRCLPMMGLHPTSVKASWETELDLIEKWFDRETFVAVGESGIDLYWDKSYLDQQKTSLERHIDWAIRFKLPLVLHSRNSLKELFDVLEAHRQKKLGGVFHCYPGGPEDAKKAIDLGFMLGIGGVVTYKNSRMAEVVAAVGLKHIILETDAPFLAPVPFRGKRNESAYLRHVAEKVAEITGTSVDEVAQTTTANARRLFALKPQP